MGIFDIFSKAGNNNEEKAAELTSKAPVGASGVEFASQFSCADVFTIEPKPLDVGIPRAKALKGRVVTLGRIKGGEFAKGDKVAVVKNGTVDAHTKILDLIPYEDGISFDTELNANMHKTKAAFDTEAWLILDVAEGVGPGDVIAKV